MRIAQRSICAFISLSASSAVCGSMHLFLEMSALQNSSMSQETPTQNMRQSRVPSWILDASETTLSTNGLTEPLEASVQIGLVAHAISTWDVLRTVSLCLLFAGAADAARHAEQMGLSTGTVEYSCEIQQDVTSLCGLFLQRFKS